MNKAAVQNEDDHRVAEMLSALPRVEAPGDFDIRVKAKIATARVPRRTNFYPFFKVAAPLGLVVVVAAFVVFYGVLPADSTTPPVAGSGPVENKISEAVPSAAQTDPPPMAAAPQDTAEPANNRDASVPSTPPIGDRVRRTDRAKPTPESRDGSVDMAIRPANVILPPGFESATSPARGNNNSNSESGPEIPVSEILEILGVRAEIVGGAWTVRSTTKTSIAERSGLVANDVIEAINDQTLAGRTALKAGFEAKTLRVRRDGKALQIDLKN
jgi:hypothetical protein